MKSSEKITEYRLFIETIQRGDFEALSSFLEQDELKNYVPFLSIGGTTKLPIHVAAATGIVAIFELLLIKGAQLNQPTILAGDAHYHRVIPETPLDIAAKAGHAKLADYMAGKGAKRGRDLFYYNRKGELVRKRSWVKTVMNCIFKRV